MQVVLFLRSVPLLESEAVKLGLLILSIALLLAGSARAQVQLVEFSATWCVPCQRMAPIVAEIEREGVAVKRIDADRSPALLTQYSVTGLPTFIATANGRETGRIVGACTKAQLVALVQSASKGTAAGQLPPWVANSVVRIYVSDRDGAKSIGSGTLVDSGDGDSVILTCAHIFAESNGKPPAVHIPGAGTFAAEVIAVDNTLDLAALSVRASHGSRALALAAAPPRIGDATTFAGYGAQGLLRASRVRTVNYVRIDNGPEQGALELNGGARSGDSGGPIFNDAYELVGVVSCAVGPEASHGGSQQKQIFGATNDGQPITVGTCCLHIRGFFQRIRARIQARRAARQKPPSVPAQPPGSVAGQPSPENPPLVAVPTQPGGQTFQQPDTSAIDKIKADFAAEKQRIVAEAEAKKAALEGKVKALTDQLAGGNLAPPFKPPGEIIADIKGGIENAAPVIEAAKPWLDPAVKALLISLGIPATGGLGGAALGAYAVIKFLRSRAKSKLPSVASGPAGGAVVPPSPSRPVGSGIDLSPIMAELSRIRNQLNSSTQQGGGAAVPQVPFQSANGASDPKQSDPVTRSSDYAKQLHSLWLDEGGDPVLAVTKGRVFEDEIESRLQSADPVAKGVIQDLYNSVRERVNAVQPYAVPQAT